MINLCAKFKVPACSRYEGMNGGAKCTYWGSLGQLGVTRGHLQSYHIPIVIGQGRTPSGPLFSKNVGALYMNTP